MSTNFQQALGEHIEDCPRHTDSLAHLARNVLSVPTEQAKRKYLASLSQVLAALRVLRIKAGFSPVVCRPQDTKSAGCHSHRMTLRKLEKL